MKIRMTKRQFETSLSSVEKRLNKFFGHPRIAELETRKMRVGRKPKGARSLLSAIKVVDGAVTDTFGGSNALTLKPGKVRVESTTTTVFDDDGMQVETLIKVWEKESS